MLLSDASSMRLPLEKNMCFTFHDIHNFFVVVLSYDTIRYKPQKCTSYELNYILRGRVLNEKGDLVTSLNSVLLQTLFGFFFVLD